MNISLENFLATLIENPKTEDKFTLEIRDSYQNNKLLYFGLLKDFPEYYKLQSKLRVRSVYRWVPLSKYRVLILIR